MPVQPHSAFSSWHAEYLFLSCYLPGLRLFFSICFWLSRVALDTFTELVLCNVHLVPGARLFFSLVINCGFQFSGFRLALWWASNFIIITIINYYFSLRFYKLFIFQEIFVVACWSIFMIMGLVYVVCVCVPMCEGQRLLLDVSLCVKARGQGWVSNSVVVGLVFWVGAHQAG